MSNKRTVLSRPRTRLYDANYNIGESYYKSALDRLDRKYSGRPLSPVRQAAPLNDLAERHARAFADEDIEVSRRRAEKKIKEEHLFDSRGARLNRASLLAENFDAEFNDERFNAIMELREKQKRAKKEKEEVKEQEDEEKKSTKAWKRKLPWRRNKLLLQMGLI